MPENSLAGKVVVITGASSGFGKGAGVEFARRGARLGLSARREDLLQDLATECEGLGAQVIVIPADVSRSDQVKRLADGVFEEFGALDVWVNNAGAGAIGRFEEVPLEDHKQVIETDLLGTLYGSYYAMQYFRKLNRGTLINISSVVGKVPNPYYSSYAAAKHGVIGLSAAIRLELKAKKIDSIRVCTIMPTSTDTPFFEHAANYLGHEFQPTPPVYEPGDVVETIVRMATDPEDEVAVGAAAKAAIFAHNLAPGMIESRMAKKTHETLEAQPPAKKTAGSVHQPMPTGAGIKGTRTRK